MKNLFLIVFLAVISNRIIAQDLIHKNYDWEKKPIPVVIDEKDSSNLEIILFEKKSSELNIGPDKNLYEYYLFHQKLKVNSDKSIEKNNKVYLPNNLEILILKIRTISPDGKVKELNKDDIIESEEENGKKYKYFALEGLEKGSEIEQILYLKLNPRITGHIHYAQGNVYKKRFELEIISPDYLTLKMKSLNGFPEMKLDSNITDRNLYKASLDQVPPIKAEKFAALEPYKMAVLYKLQDNKARGTKNIFNYSRITETVYNNVYGDYPKNSKVFTKYIKKNKIKPTDPELDNILKIEELLKQDRFIFDFDFVIGSGKMDDMLTSMFSTSMQMVQMMAQLARFLNIEHQVVLTSDRFDINFDKDFECYNFLTDYIIYFPNSKLYIAPTQKFSRAGYITPGFYNNYGLFLNVVKVGDMESAVGKIKFIEPMDHKSSTDSLFLRCQLTSDHSKFLINYTRSVTGYYAKQHQPFYVYLKDKKDELKELNESFTTFLTDDIEEVKSINVTNIEKNDFPKKPLVTEAELEVDKFIDEAGEKLLLKIGEMIGPQAELYQEGKRWLPVENAYNRTYFRRIEFTIPDGYKISNPESIKINVFYKNPNGKTTLEFKSDYLIEGNKLIILCTEMYDQISFSVDLFEEFRKVINASADFNKITLVLEKK